MPTLSERYTEAQMLTAFRLQKEGMPLRLVGGDKRVITTIAALRDITRAPSSTSKDMTNGR